MLRMAYLLNSYCVGKLTSSYESSLAYSSEFVPLGSWCLCWTSTSRDMLLTVKRFHSVNSMARYSQNMPVLFCLNTNSTKKVVLRCCHRIEEPCFRAWRMQASQALIGCDLFTQASDTHRFAATKSTFFITTFDTPSFSRAITKWSLCFMCTSRWECVFTWGSMCSMSCCAFFNKYNPQSPGRSIKIGVIAYWRCSDIFCFHRFDYCVTAWFRCGYEHDMKMLSPNTCV